jgi:DNA polymerase-3 subunit delta'
VKILGHKDVLDALSRANARQSTHHAYLFSGPRGVGKRRVAIYYSALINCLGKRATQPCGACRHCVKISRLLSADATPHPDVMIIEPDGRTIKIQQIRAFMKVVPYPPLETSYRIVIIDQADTMGEAAANALLKTLEEPPSTTRFVLVTDRPDALLTTIRSRCQRITFTRLAKADVVDGLVSLGGQSPAEAEAIAPAADGSLGLALELIDDPIMSNRDTYIEQILQCPVGDINAAFNLVTTFRDTVENMSTLFDLLKRVFRDILLAAYGMESKLSLTYPQHADLIRRWAQNHGAEGIRYRLELIGDTERLMLDRNINARLALERLFASIYSPRGQEGARQIMPHTT